jgi:DNA-binding GntR family transcriptional regulator
MTTLAWVAVAEQIRRDIQARRIGPNGELDTEAELCQRFATSRITIRRALAELRSEGLVVSRRGSGSRAVLPGTQPLALVITAGADSAQPLTLNRSKVRWRTSRPTADLAVTLLRAGITKPPSGQWLRLTYEQRVDGMPFDEATVWFPPSTMPFVSRTDFAFGPTAKLVEHAGLPLGRAIQTVSTGWNEARAQRGEPAPHCFDLTLERVMLTVSNDIAFVSVHRHRSALACFRIDLPTTNQTSDTRFILASL